MKTLLSVLVLAGGIGIGFFLREEIKTKDTSNITFAKMQYNAPVQGNTVVPSAPEGGNCGG